MSKKNLLSIKMTNCIYEGEDGTEAYFGNLIIGLAEEPREELQLYLLVLKEDDRLIIDPTRVSLEQLKAVVEHWEERIKEDTDVQH